MKKVFLIVSVLLSGIFVFAQEDVIITDTLNTGEEPAYVIVDKMPEFPGGQMALRLFIAENMTYPEEAAKRGVQGTIYIRFLVLKDGSIGEVQVQRGVDPLLDAEAVRVVKSLPEFEPGMQSGKPVNVWWTVPVRFKVN